MTGHCIGASGVIESIAGILGMNENFIHATINLDNPDPECDLDCVPNVAREAKLKTVISNSFGFGGHNATLLIKAVA